MSGDYTTIYQAARKATPLTQEQAAEQLDTSVESVKAYELGGRLPPNAMVAKMVQVYDTPWLALEHLQVATAPLGVLPDGITVQALPTAAIRLINSVLNFADRHRDRQLLCIAEDGIISEEEQPIFDEIVLELDGIIRAALQVKYTPESAKKERPDAGTSKRSVFRTFVENDCKNIIPHRAKNASPNFAGTEVTAP